MTNLWKKWTINCAIGELLGIACAGGIAFGINSIIGEPQSLGNKLVVLISMMFAGFIEGAVLGLFQWKVLVTKFQNIPKKEWMFYTILVGILGWFLGMLPSLFFIPNTTEAQTVNEGMDFSNPYIFAFLSVSVGLGLGAVFGLFQWFSLKKYAQKAYKWIIANALGWGLGLGWIYLFASIPTEKSTLTFNILMGIIGGVLAGLSVGAITGIYLVKLKKKNNHS
jgi:hypothetical protein